jgi:hypothetical protein
MTDRFPLIINSEDQQIQELSSGDKLDLTGSGVVADVFTVDTNSQERLRIDSSGNVLIGSTTQATADIALNADGSATFADRIAAGSPDNGTATVTTNYALTAYNTSATLPTIWARNGTVNGPVFVGVNAANSFTTTIKEDGSATFTGAVETNGGFRATGNLSGTWTTGSGWEVLSTGINAYDRGNSQFIAGEINTLNWNIDTDGSASFAGDVEVKMPSSGWWGDGGIILGNSGYLYISQDTSTVTNQLFKLNNPSFGGDVVIFQADGSATFAGGVASNRYFEVKRPAGNVGDPAFQAFIGTDENVRINSDGSAEFAGETIVKGDLLKRTAAGSTVAAMRDDYLRVYDNPVSYDDYTISLEKDGSAAFAGRIAAGSPDNGTATVTTNYALTAYNTSASLPTIWARNGTANGSVFVGVNAANSFTTTIKEDGSAKFGPLNISSSTGYGAQVDMAANAATVNAQCQQTASQYTLLFAGYQGANRNFHVTAAGAAEFAGIVNVGSLDYTSNSGVGSEIRNDGLIRVQRASGSASAVYQAWRGNLNTLNISADGTATFAGEVVAGVRDSQGVFMTPGGALEGFNGGSRKYSLSSDGSATFKDYVNVQINSSNLAKLQFESSASRLQYSNVTGHLEVYTNNAVRNKFLYNGQGTAFSNQNVVYPEPDNSILLGNSSYRWQAIWAANGTIQTSDSRLKHEVENSVLGTDFIKALRPVSYKWIEGGKSPVVEGKDENGDDVYAVDENGDWTYEPNSGARQHWGFIAQEVKQAVDNAGVDFGGWVLADKDDADSTQSLRYDQFIAPLTKALQEAIAEIETLKVKVAALEAS